LNKTKSGTKKYFNEKNSFKEVWAVLIVAMFYNISVTPNGSELINLICNSERGYRDRNV
jgi:hypothetical protein